MQIVNMQSRLTNSTTRVMAATTISLLLAAQVQGLLLATHQHVYQGSPYKPGVKSGTNLDCYVATAKRTARKKPATSTASHSSQVAAPVVDPQVEPSLAGNLVNDDHRQQLQQQQQQRERKDHQQYVRQGKQQRQRRHGAFMGAEDVAEQLAGGEGLARAEEGVDNTSNAGVFYNRVGAINRDLSVLMVYVLAEAKIAERDSKERERSEHQRCSTSVPLGSGGGAGGGVQNSTVGANTGTCAAEYVDQEGLVVLDAFAASGVRALRYLTEVPGVRKVVANDHDKTAIGMIRRAADLCGVGQDKLEVHHGDALDTMYAARARGSGSYDVVDIDPYGCAAGYLDAAVEAVTDGGLLCITSTDMPVLSGTQPAVAYSRYGSVPTRAGYHHEMSLRILLHATSAAAGRHRRSIKPVLSVAVDHYVRIFVRVFRSPKDALKEARNSTSYILQSEACSSFFMLPVLPQQQQRRQQLAGDTTSARATVSVKDTVENTPFKVALDSLPGASAQGCVAGETVMSNPAAASTPCPGGLCPETGAALMLGGPLWSGPLHDAAWVDRAIALAGVSSAEDRAKVTSLEDSVLAVSSEAGGDEGRDERIAPVHASSTAAPSCGRHEGNHASVDGRTDSALDGLAEGDGENGDGDNRNESPVRKVLDDAAGVAVSATSAHYLSTEGGSIEAGSGVEIQSGGDEMPPRPRLAAGVRTESLLRAVARELPDVPLFYNLRDMFATIGLARHPQREQVMGALEAAGYRTSGKHKEPYALKTDAPDAAVWDVLRCWLRDNPQSDPPPRASGAVIVARGPQLISKVDFVAAERLGLKGNGGGQAASRGHGDFLHAHNPERRWGPIARGTVTSARIKRRR